MPNHVDPKFDIRCVKCGRSSVIGYKHTEQEYDGRPASLCDTWLMGQVKVECESNTYSKLVCKCGQTWEIKI